VTGIRLKYLHCFNDRHGKPHCSVIAVSNGRCRCRALKVLPLPTMGS
jgi:hypothetical protein